MFDIGWQELALIVVVTLVVVGPKDLPKVMRTMGEIAAKGRRAWLALEHQIDGIEAETKRLETETKEAKDASPQPPSPCGRVEKIAARSNKDFFGEG